MEWKKSIESISLLSIGAIVFIFTVMLGTLISSPIGSTVPSEAYNVSIDRMTLTPVPYLPGFILAVVFAGVMTAVIFHYWKDDDE